MNGSITSRDVLRHTLVILREFGPMCYLRCIKAVLLRRHTTFLNVAFHK
jgi:hypothetical protein